MAATKDSHLDALKLEIGTRLKLKDGSVVELTENPMDGVWLFCRYVSSPEASRSGLEDQPVYAEDIAAVLT